MSYQNIPTEKFHKHFSDMMQKKIIKAKDWAEKLGKYESNPTSFFNKLQTGENSITLEHILIAQQYFDLDPCTLFEKMYKPNELPLTTATENESVYSNKKMMDMLISQQEVIASQQKIIASYTGVSERRKQRSA